MNKGSVKIGIGYENDRKFETNKSVFAIFGPHTLNYGEDQNDEHDEGVHLVFTPQALHHPDVFITPMAATFYMSGHGDTARPWWLQEKNEQEPYDAMSAEKLHPSSPLFYDALAWEFLARPAQKKGSNDLCSIT